MVDEALEICADRRAGVTAMDGLVDGRVQGITRRHFWGARAYLIENIERFYHKMYL